MRLEHLSIAFTALVGCYLLVVGVDFALDDAWIHLAYAKSLKLGEGLSYNPYDYETGASSPLWVLILAIVPWFDHPMWVSKGLGLCFHLGSLYFLLRLLREWFPKHSSMRLCLLGLCAGLAPLLLQGAVSGMAVSLAVLLWMGALWSLHKKHRMALLLVFLSVAARSELVVFWGLWGCLHALYEHRMTRLATAMSAALSLGLWMLYCQLVSGFWFPNTKYVKGLGQTWDSLYYLPQRYLWEEPILWSGLGLGVIIYGLLKNKAPHLWILAASWLGGMVATALTRSLDPSVLFFQSRYFAPLSLSLVILLAGGLSTLKRSELWLLPILLLTLWQLPKRIALIADQESDIARLHTQPALQMAQSLPPESIVLVEGAGASRFHLSRDMWVLDVIGLNHQPIAHMTSFSQLRCYLAQRPIDFAVLPRHMVNRYMDVYALEELMAFEEAQYHQTEPPFTHHVYIFRSLGIRPEVAQACAEP